MLDDDKKDRFNLEDEILALTHLADDIDIVASDLIDRASPDVDSTFNALIGLAALLRLRSNQMFDTMVSAFNLKG